MDTLLLACTVLALPLAAVAVGMAVRVGRLSVPVQTRRMVAELQERCEIAEKEVLRGRAHWAEVRAELDGFYTQCEDALQAAEKKRRRAAASESRERKEAPPQDMNDPITLRQIARSQGML